MVMKIKEFILKNEVVVKNWLVENGIVNEDDNINYHDGNYEDEYGEDHVTDEVCSIYNIGCDFSFDKKYLNIEYGDCDCLELNINGKALYAIVYII
jgi:hypothetical protein